MFEKIKEASDEGHRLGKENYDPDGDVLEVVESYSATYSDDKDVRKAFESAFKAGWKHEHSNRELQKQKQAIKQTNGSFTEAAAKGGYNACGLVLFAFFLLVLVGVIGALL